MLKRYHTGKTVIWYDDTLIKDPSLPIFDSNYWEKENKIVGSAKGRGTTWFIQLDEIQAALRHYRRGGTFGKLVKNQYCFMGWEKTRSFQELSLLEHLLEQGVNVPKPIAARAKRSGLSYRADLLSERIPGARDLVSLLSDAPLTPQLYEKIGQEIAKMHNAGVNHSDLNIHNILIDQNQKVWIIDFDKCGLTQSASIMESNIARLLRSFEKEKIRKQIHWQKRDFKVLNEAYLNDLTLTKGSNSV
ncbi:3-deoxy-D-manno-octulosonic acid kinase [Vibrio astriarenae]|uniref:3-deoxy-D-manno-octulosonic acid kinase n=1 Tax=Vibrio astriarenae TaxID=1481923 RepID=UPI0037369B54